MYLSLVELFQGSWKNS